MASARSVVSVQRRSATMSGPGSGQKLHKLFAGRGVGGCVILRSTRQVPGVVYGGWQAAEGGDGGRVVEGVSRGLTMCCAVLLCSAAKRREVEGSWLHGWVGMVEGHDRPKSSR